MATANVSFGEAEQQGRVWRQMLNISRFNHAPPAAAIADISPIDRQSWLIKGLLVDRLIRQEC